MMPRLAITIFIVNYIVIFIVILIVIFIVTFTCSVDDPVGSKYGRIHFSCVSRAHVNAQLEKIVHSRLFTDNQRRVCKTSLTHTQANTHKHTLKHAHTLTHSNTHKQTRTHTQTHTHTHTGIVSFGNHKCTGGAGYTRIAHYLDWIEEQMSGKSTAVESGKLLQHDRFISDFSQPPDQDASFLII